MTIHGTCSPFLFFNVLSILKTMPFDNSYQCNILKKLPTFDKIISTLAFCRISIAVVAYLGVSFIMAGKMHSFGKNWVLKSYVVE